MSALQPAHYSRLATRECPYCGSVLHRMRRTVADQLISVFAPVQRFRCTHFACQWEGNLRVRSADFVITSTREDEAASASPAAASPPPQPPGRDALAPRAAP